MCFKFEKIGYNDNNELVYYAGGKYWVNRNYQYVEIKIDNVENLTKTPKAVEYEVYDPKKENQNKKNEINILKWLGLGLLIWKILK